MEHADFQNPVFEREDATPRITISRVERLNAVSARPRHELGAMGAMGANRPPRRATLPGRA